MAPFAVRLIDSPSHIIPELTDRFGTGSKPTFDIDVPTQPLISVPVTVYEIGELGVQITFGPIDVFKLILGNQVYVFAVVA